MEIKQTKSLARFCGKLQEKALTVEAGSIKDANGKEIPCEIVKGTITVKTDNGVFPLRVYSASKKKDKSENKMFKGLKTIAEQYISEVDAAKDDSVEANVVDCNVKININDYVGQDGNVKTTTQMSLNSAKRVTADVEHTTDIAMVGYIGAIKPEVNKDDEETGRLMVTFVTVGYGGRAEPYTLYVDTDLADDFEDMYEAGQTAELYLSATMRHVGAKTTAQAGFGRKAKVNSGYDVMELVVIGGEPPYEDEEDDDGNSLALDRKTIKKLMEEREMYLENLKTEKKDAKKETKSKKSGLSSRKAKVEEAPFDVDDDGMDDVDDLF